MRLAGSQYWPGDARRFSTPLRAGVVPVSRYLRLPAGQESGCGPYAVLLEVSNGDTDPRDGHGGIRDGRNRMTADRNQRHRAEPTRRATRLLGAGTNIPNIRARLVIWIATRIVVMVDRSLQRP